MKEKEISTEKLIEENNLLQEQLNEENKEYYQNLLLYVRTKDLFKDENESEELLFQILTDLIEAQKKGKTAVEYLGKDPETLGDELIMSLKKASFSKIFQFFAVGFGMFLFYFVIGDLTDEKPFDLGYVLLQILLFIPAIYLIFYTMGKSVYHQKWLPVVPFVVFIGAIILIPYVVPPFLVVEPSTPLKWMIVVVSGCLVGGYFIKLNIYELLPAFLYFFIRSLLKLTFDFSTWEKTGIGLGITAIAALLTLVATFLLFRKRAKE